MDGPRQWDIVGGAEKGGVLVKEGRDASSKQEPMRLATGSVVEELDLVAERLCYRLLTGTGPPEGWISTVISKKVMARPVGAPLDAPLPRGEAAPAPAPRAVPGGPAVGEASRPTTSMAASGRGDVGAIPSLDDVLSSIDQDARRGDQVPSLDEVLASIERDAKEEADLEQAVDSRQQFFELGNSMQLANVGPVVLPTKEELEVQADIVTHFGKFSYGSMKALGEAILSEAKQQGGHESAGSLS